MILGSVLRYTVRREEEIGARLSNKAYMNPTDPIDNPEAGMGAMRLLDGKWAGKRNGSAEGSGAISNRYRDLSGGNAAGAREGGETPAVLVAYLWAGSASAKQGLDMTRMRGLHVRRKNADVSTDGVGHSSDGVCWLTDFSAECCGNRLALLQI